MCTLAHVPVHKAHKDEDDDQRDKGGHHGVDQDADGTNVVEGVQALGGCRSGNDACSK